MSSTGELIAHKIGVSKNSGTWQRLLFHWCAVLNSYLEWEEGDDLPHWHNERAQVGFLSAAAWRMGGVALEEYCTSRADNDRTDVTQKTPGRCDLYISVEKLNCVFEAKCAELTFSRENENQVDNRLQESHNQLQTLEEKDRKRCDGMALCWGVVETTRGNEDDEERQLRKFADKLSSPNRVIGVYYVPCFKRPEKLENDYGVNGKTYPGVVLIGETHPWK